MGNFPLFYDRPILAPRWINGKFMWNVDDDLPQKLIGIFIESAIFLSPYLKITSQTKS